MLKPDITLSHGRLKQGLKGQLLKDNPFSADSMSKRKLLCILSSLYDPFGVYMSILRLTLKALYSTVCLSIPGKDRASFDRPISSVSPELAKVTTDLCNLLDKIDQIKPMKRNVIPVGHDVHHLILSKDGSSVGFSSTLHVATRSDLDENSYTCRIVKTAS